MSDESRWDWYPRQEAGRQERPFQYRLEPEYGRRSYPPGQPQYGQQDWDQYQDQPPYSPYDRPPSQPSFTANPRYGYGAPPGQHQGQTRCERIPGRQPSPQTPPQWYDPDLPREYQHGHSRQQQAGSGPPRRRKRSRVAVYAVIAGLVVIAGAGGAFARTLLSNRTGAAGAAQPLTCKQQYDAWKTGPAHAQAKQLDTDLTKVTAASSAEDITALTSALEAAGAEAAALERYPMPACADPHGYWGQVLARIKAAGDNAGSASGLGGILLADAPLKQVPGLGQKLSAELKRAAESGNLPSSERGPDGGTGGRLRGWRRSRHRRIGAQGTDELWQESRASHGTGASSVPRALRARCRRKQPALLAICERTHRIRCRGSARKSHKIVTNLCQVRNCCPIKGHAEPLVTRERGRPCRAEVRRP